MQTRRIILKIYRLHSSLVSNVQQQNFLRTIHTIVNSKQFSWIPFYADKMYLIFFVYRRLLRLLAFWQIHLNVLVSSYNKHLHPTVHTILTDLKSEALERLLFKASFFVEMNLFSPCYWRISIKSSTDNWENLIYKSSFFFFRGFYCPDHSPYYPMLQLSKKIVVWSIPEHFLISILVSLEVFVMILSNERILKFFVRIYPRFMKKSVRLKKNKLQNEKNVKLGNAFAWLFLWVVSYLLSAFTTTFWARR